MEVFTINDGSDVSPLLAQKLAPLRLLLISGCAPRDVMHRTDGDAAAPLLGQFQDIDKRPWPTLSHFVTQTVRLFMQLSKAEDLCKHLLCLLTLRFRQGNPIDAADGVLRGNRTLLPAAAPFSFMMVHEFPCEPLRLTEPDNP